jgi:methionyl-tRNA formyltransferase
MDMVSEMDAGNYYQQYKIDISNNETYNTLYEKLTILINKKAALSLIEIDENKVEGTIQDLTKVTK